MLSPFLQILSTAMLTAAMPEAVAKAPTPPSIRAIFFSKISVVGFESLVYIHVSCSRSKTLASSSQVSYLYVVLISRGTTLDLAFSGQYSP